MAHVGGKMESGSDLMGLAEGQRAWSWQHRLLHLLTRILGKLRVREGRTKKQERLVASPKARKEARKLVVGVSLSLSIEWYTLSVQMHTWLLYSELYPRGTLTPLCVLGLRINEDMQKEVSALDLPEQFQSL